MSPSYAFFGKGEYPTHTEPGDFALVVTDRPQSLFIRAMIRGPYSHAAQIVGREGQIVEALSRGVVRSDLRDWKDAEFVVVSPDLSSEDRDDVVAHALWLAGEGWRYDWATFLGMSVFWGTGGRLMVSAGAKAAICSAVVADSQHAGGERFSEKIPHFYTPEDLRCHYGVPGRG